MGGASCGMIQWISLCVWFFPAFKGNECVHYRKRVTYRCKKKKKQKLDNDYCRNCHHTVSTWLSFLWREGPRTKKDCIFRLSCRTKRLHGAELQLTPADRKQKQEFDLYFVTKFMDYLLLQHNLIKSTIYFILVYKHDTYIMNKV